MDESALTSVMLKRSGSRGVTAPDSKPYTSQVDTIRQALPAFSQTMPPWVTMSELAGANIKSDIAMENYNRSLSDANNAAVALALREAQMSGNADILKAIASNPDKYAEVLGNVEGADVISQVLRNAGIASGRGDAVTTQQLGHDKTVSEIARNLAAQQGLVVAPDLNARHNLVPHAVQTVTTENKRTTGVGATDEVEGTTVQQRQPVRVGGQQQQGGAAPSTQAASSPATGGLSTNKALDRATATQQVTKLERGDAVRLKLPRPQLEAYKGQVQITTKNGEIPLPGAYPVIDSKGRIYMFTKSSTGERMYIVDKDGRVSSMNTDAFAAEMGE